MKKMKCWRVLYKPDDTAFMVWADTEEEAYEKVKARNISELDEGGNLKRDYVIDEFTPKTNGNGIIAFYDAYSVDDRKDKNGNPIEYPD